MPLYKVESINLKSTKFGEADKLLTLFSRSRGKIKAIAKSASKPGSKFGGRLEPLAYNSMLLAKGRNLDILSQAQTIETFHKIREGEKSLRAGLYMAKIIDWYLEDGMAETSLFNLILDCLYMLKQGVMPQLVTRIFDVRFADIEGFLPSKEFSPAARGFVDGIKSGDPFCHKFTKGDIREIDRVLIPCLCEHLGKDIRIWKSL